VGRCLPRPLALVQREAEVLQALLSLVRRLREETEEEQVVLEASLPEAEQGRLGLEVEDPKGFEERKDCKEAVEDVEDVGEGF